MTLKKAFGEESLKIKVKGDEVTIKIRTQNWNGVSTELLETMALHARNHGTSIADRLEHALKLEAREASRSQESYDRLIRLCENLAAAKQKTQNSSDDVDPDNIEPN